MTKIEEISEKLRKGGHKLCLAESFTGGGVASAFIALPGASDILAASIVCYAEAAKMKLLSVKEETLKTYGAVSEQTVSEMLDGLSALSLGDIFAATSGNAGPTAEKPGEEGLFYVGVMMNGKKTVKRFRIDGSRGEVIDGGIDACITLIGSYLL